MDVIVNTTFSTQDSVRNELYPVARPIFPPHATAISANPVTFFLTRTYEAKASKHKYNIVKRVSNYKKFWKKCLSKIPRQTVSKILISRNVGEEKIAAWKSFSGTTKFLGPSTSYERWKPFSMYPVFSHWHKNIMSAHKRSKNDLEPTKIWFVASTWIQKRMAPKTKIDFRLVKRIKIRGAQNKQIKQVF